MAVDRVFNEQHLLSQWYAMWYVAKELWMYKGLVFFIHALLFWGRCIIFSKMPPCTQSDHPTPPCILDYSTNTRFLPYYAAPVPVQWKKKGVLGNHSLLPKQTLRHWWNMPRRQTSCCARFLTLSSSLAMVRPTWTSEIHAGVPYRAIAL